MLWPTILFPGKVLVLSEIGSFNAAYIRRTLEFCGVPVVAPPGTPVDVLAALAPDDLTEITGCVAVDLDTETFAKMAGEQWRFPFLFVGGAPGATDVGAFTWMQAPFASYQVVDALLKLVSDLPGEPRLS